MRRLRSRKSPHDCLPAQLRFGPSHSRRTARVSDAACATSPRHRVLHPGGTVLPLTAKNRPKGTRMDILARLDETRSATNVLEHPFYQRWSAGELSAEELECYAGEYRHAVVALASASELAAQKADAAHAEGLRRVGLLRRELRR